MIGMYGKWGLMEEGRKVFDRAANRDLYSWNTMIAAYVGSGNMEQAKELFDRMQDRDVVSWSTVLAGYVQVLLVWKLNTCSSFFHTSTQNIKSCMMILVLSF